MTVRPATSPAPKPILNAGSDEFLDDPHPVFDRLRGEHPVVTDAIGWSTLDYATSAQAFADRALTPGIDPLLETLGIEPLWGEHDRTLTDSEGDVHRRLRRVVSPWFSNRRIEELRTRVAALADELVADAAPDEPFDVMADLADVVPSRLFCWMVGAPESDAAHLAALSKTLLSVFTATAEMVEPVRDAKREMAALTRELIAARRRQPGDDIVSMMLAAVDAGDLDDEDLFFLVEELLSASVDNTANTTGLAVWTLLQHPDVYRRVGDDPAMIAPAAEECGRYEPAIRHTIKFALADTNIGGVDIPAGGFVTIRIAAAHRDPAVFADPHRFDVDRDWPKQQLAFGLGRHFCLGAALGRMEIAEMVRALAADRPRAEIGEHVEMSKNAAGIVHRLEILPGAPR
ncbi:MAG: cytochrome P450 [Ilumatobacteraceae bacterium]